MRLYLLPDDRCQHQTEVKRRTRNPNFCEVFNFQVPRDHLRQRVLRFSVYDHGKGRRGDVIGHVLYSLKDEKYGVEIWRDLETLSEVRVCV
jgi:Ca2+-dependent lipid-binding protein